jgi:type III secretion HrpO family protein
MNPMTSLLVEALMLVFWLSMPSLVMATLVGLLLGLLQSVTQVQDQSLPYAAKILCIGLTIVVTASWMSRQVEDLMERATLIAPLHLERKAAP